MIEMLMGARKAERRPWEMFFVGLFYATIVFLLVAFIFGKDGVLVDGSGLLLVIFTVICCMPFMYYIIKREENKDVEITETGRLLKEHSKAIRALMWLFLGLVIAFSFWYLVLPEHASQSFNFQIRTYCAINSPGDYGDCLETYGLSRLTGMTNGAGKVVEIFANNVYVLIFTIVFSLAFGAGAIFILVWNATVIAAAIGIFFRANFGSAISIGGFFLSLLRFMIHGIPEITGYFIGALAGGIVSVAVIRRDLDRERMWAILQDALLLVLIAIVVLIASAIIEVYITPVFF